VERLLDRERAAVGEQLAGISSLHAGRLVLIPGAGRAAANGAPSARELVLLESNFDGSAEEHLSALGRALGALGGLLAHCEGDLGANASIEAQLRAGSRRSDVYFTAHAGLSVERVRADASLRAEFTRLLRTERRSLDGESPVVVVERLRSLLIRGAGAREWGLGREERRPADIAPPAASPFVSLARAMGLFPWLTRSVIHDVSDHFRALWTDETLDRAGLDERLDRLFALETPGTQRALTHVTEVKPGRFRRRALRRALRFVQSWLREAPDGAQVLGSSHFARFVELGDGRLVFLSHHDGSLEAELGRFVERLGFIASLVWSNTRDFPASFGPFFGGARDEASFKDWARVKSVPTQIAYSAYPELSLSDVARGAELRKILGSPLDEPAARRALNLV
jgi:hypothetical protein